MSENIDKSFSNKNETNFFENFKQFFENIWKSLSWLKELINSLFWVKKIIQKDLENLKSTLPDTKPDEKTIQNLQAQINKNSSVSPQSSQLKPSLKVWEDKTNITLPTKLDKKTLQKPLIWPRLPENIWTWEKILKVAKQNFSSKTHEYGRFDLRKIFRGNITDQSRFNQDLDKDWKKWVDCSSLIYYSFQKCGINLWNVLDFTTRKLFNWKNFTNFAKQNFDIISKPDIQKKLKPWDIIMMKHKNWYQHVMLFEKYTNQWKIVAFGSQTDTWPASSILTWPIWSQFNIVGALRYKS